jgi:hypothetical protein
MLLLLRKPFFLLFKPLVREALLRFMDEHEAAAVSLLYETLTRGLQRSVQFTLFDKHFIINVPSLEQDPFPGTSLVDLLRVFRQDVLLIWYALLAGQRVLFLGPSGEAVGNAALAAVLMVLPLRGFEEVLSPFVALADTSPLERKSYVAGSSNPILANNTKLFDALALIDRGTVTHTQGVEPTAEDRDFIRRVLRGVEQQHEDEKWVRRQFAKYTGDLLRRILAQPGGAAALKHPHARLLVELERSARFQRFAEEERRAAAPQNPAMAAFAALLAAQEDGADVTAVQMMKLFFQLDQELSLDIEDVEAICELGGVGVVARGLASESSQVRKHAINVLSKLSASIHGQIDLKQRPVLTQVIAMLQVSARGGRECSKR